MKTERYQLGYDPTIQQRTIIDTHTNTVVAEAPMAPHEALRLLNDWRNREPVVVTAVEETEKQRRRRDMKEMRGMR